MSHKKLRITSCIKKILCMYCLRHIPYVVIHHITASKNLSYINIFYTSDNDQFKCHTNKMRKYIADNLYIRRVPAINFIDDKKHQKDHNALLQKIYS